MSDDQSPNKKRRVRHSLRHVQHMPQHVEPAPQDQVFSQGQLLRSITIALHKVGFDSVNPSALEMFRSHTEEYMLRLLGYVRVSMQGARRTRPTPQDFSMAMSLLPNARSASLLEPQLSEAIPEQVSYPSIPDPDPPPAPTPDFSALLQPLITAQPPKYIPAHFPQLPPRHAWVQTPVFPEREKDARKMREKATEEGMMAEQALRKLAAAAKTGALKAEKRRSGVLSGHGRVRGGGTGRAESKEDAFADVLKDIGGLDESDRWGMDGANGAREDGVDVGMPEGVIVNHDMGHWRHGGSRRSLRL